MRKRWLGTSAGLVLAIGLATPACAPLPGRTVDPLYLGAGARAGGGPPPVRDQWAGRYDDSRGSGEMVIQLRRSGTQLEGVWQLRTGGDGVLTGSVLEGGSRVRFQLANQGGTCLVLLDGAGEISVSTWTATYSGRDCQGTISNGRFSLSKQ